MATDFLTTLEKATPGRTIAVAAGGNVFRQGEPVRFLYRVASGRVRLSRVLTRGAEIALARVSAGNLLAEASVFSSRYHCDAIAETPATLLRYAMRDVLAVLEAQPRMAMAFGAHLAHELMDLRATVEIRAIRRADERLLAWLQLRATGAPAAFDGSGAWPSVARQIGLTAESLYRALARLERSGKIRRRGGRVTLAPMPRS
jgi:CRP-like cAMP-binding protein